MPEDDFLEGIEIDNQADETKVLLTRIKPTVNVDTVAKPELLNPSLTDSDLITPILVSQITEDTEPLMPLPRDAVADIFYTIRVEPRCVLCKCPYRTEAEHWYVQNAYKPMAVVRFFAEYFGASISYEQVQNHMAAHCNLTDYGSKGLVQIAMGEEEVSPYIYREKQLAMTGILLQINEVQAIDTRRNPELALKKSLRLESLYKTLKDLAKERDEAGGDSLNILEVLNELIKRMPTKESQQIVIDYTKELHKKLQKG